MDSVQENLNLVAGKLEAWGKSLVLMLPNLISAAVVVGLFALFARIARRAVARMLGRVSERDQLNRLLVSLTANAVLVVGVVIALNILKLDRTVMSLLAGVGVIGLALGFAFQDIAANLMAGILILLRRPFRAGDIVKTNEYYGKVQRINLRNTIVKTWTGQIVLIPNKEVFQRALTNFSREGERRVDLCIGVSYGDDLQKVERVARQAVCQIAERDTRREPEFFYTDFGSSSINCSLRFWLKFPEEHSFLQARHEAIKAIKTAFDDNKISIPFPIRTLDFGIKGGETLHETLGGIVPRTSAHGVSGGDRAVAAS